MSFAASAGEEADADFAAGVVPIAISGLFCSHFLKEYHLVGGKQSTSGFSEQLH